MIEAQHKTCWIRIIRLFYRLMFRIHFRKLIVNNMLQSPPAGAVLMIGNHFSWWDGFFADHVNALLFHKKLHIMMLEEQLRTRMFLNKAGAFSITPGSRGIIESLAYAAKVLHDNNNVLMMYPQGLFQSMGERTFRFSPGIIRIMKAQSQNVQLIFLAALVDYFSRPRPSVVISLKAANINDFDDIQGLVAAYDGFYLECLSRQKTLLGEDR